MAEAGGSSASWNVFRLISGYLVISFLWRLFVPAHEYDMRSAQVLDICLNVLLIVGLVGAHSTLKKNFPPDDSRWGFASTLFWAGMVAGVGMLLIRLTSDAAWWTGHLRYSLD